MAEIVSWVSDRLHEIIGLSDRQVAEYITELARKSVSLKELTRKLQSTGTINMTKSVEEFADELWRKFPRERAVKTQFSNRLVKQEKKVYKLILDDPVEEVESLTGFKHDGKKSRNIRPQKSYSQESDEEDMQSTRVIDRDEDSDSDEWERLVLCNSILCARGLV